MFIAYVSTFKSYQRFFIIFFKDASECANIYAAEDTVRVLARFL